MPKRFGPEKSHSISLDKHLVPDNLALLQHRLPIFFPTIEELRSKNLPLFGMSSISTLFWYFNKQEGVEGKIINIFPEDYIEAVDELNNKHRLIIDSGLVSVGEMAIYSEVRAGDKKLVREYSIGPEGYYARFSVPKRKIKDNSERRLYKTRELFNTPFELARLSI